MEANLKKPLKGLRADIYLPKGGGDCSNGGISSFAQQVTLVGPGLPELVEADPLTAPAVKLVKRNIGGTVLHVEPVIEDGQKGWFCYGGALVDVSDSRFTEALKANGYPGYCALRLHDRREW